MKIFVSRKSAGDLEKCTLECHQGVSAHPAIHCVGDILWIPLGEGKIDPRCILEDWKMALVGWGRQLYVGYLLMGESTRNQTMYT